MPSTLKDIAAELGLSINTVSRALRDMPDISPETTVLVKETAARLGYRKNLSASRLRTNKSLTIGMVVTDIGNPVFSNMIKGIEQVCMRTNYSLMLGNSNESMDEESAIINSMLAHGVDGFVIVPSMQGTSSLLQLNEARIPYVILQRKFADFPAHYVQSNDFTGGYLAAEHLYGLGHRTFLYVSAPRHISSALERYNGFLSYIKGKGLSENNVVILECDGTKAGGDQAFSQWIAQHPVPDATAVFCFSDYVAYGVYSAIGRHGLRIPEDLSVIGYDNIEYSDVILPALTTVDIRPLETGKYAAELLVNLANVPNPLPGHGYQEIVIRPRLVKRDSTGFPRTQKEPLS